MNTSQSYRSRSDEIYHEAFQLHSSDELMEEFRSLNQNYSNLITQAGYYVLANRPGSSKQFASFGVERQREVCRNLKRNLAIYQSAADKGVDPRSNREQSLLWHALRILQLRPPSQLFQFLSADDIIEIYDCHHVQVFRSFNMFECLSYSLEELHSYEWWELYERDERHTTTFVQYLTKLVSGEIPGPVLVNGEPHLVHERFSPKRRAARISTKLFCPLFANSTTEKGIQAYLSATRLHNLES